jgi:steroid delta-isomerase-like uncharacterized protein
MSTDTDLIRRIFDGVYLDGNVALVDELFTDDFTDHDVPAGYKSDKEGQRQLTQQVLEGFSDRKLEFDDLMETTDERIVHNWAMIGTHSGEFLGIPASGQQVRVHGVDVYRCENGKVAEHWGAFDMSDFIEKTGT